MRRVVTLLSLVVFLGAVPAVASASTIALQNATATYFQSGLCPGPWQPSTAINGSLVEGAGWAIARNVSGSCSNPSSTNPETIWFETVGSQGSATGTVYTFDLHQLFGNFHTLSRFDLSYTTSTQVGGFSDANATWIPLTLASASATNGATLTFVGNVVQAGVANPTTSVYTITTTQLFVTGITGFRLNALLDPSLVSTQGPGRAINGNFVLTEFQVDGTNSVVPEPGTLILVGLGIAGIASRFRRRKS